MSFDSTINAKAVQLAKLTYEITAAAGSGHPSTGASLAHLVAVLMYQHMRYEPTNPLHSSADRLVLSEGHAVPIVYAACADLGVHFGKDRDNLKPLTLDIAKSLREVDSPIDGHPNPIEGFPFFDTATGSLGQGLSSAAGLALAARLDGFDKRVFCIIGDGESREGQIWEAIDFLKDHDLKAVCPIFNCNAFAQTQEVSPQQSWETTAKKLEAAGFNALVIDGHKGSAIADALAEHAKSINPDAKPVAIVAKTVKGWGAASQQGNGHHGTAVKGDALEGVLKELDETEVRLGAIADASLKIAMMSPKPDRERPAGAKPLAFEDAMKTFGQEKALASGKFATRKAYGVALRAIGHAHPDVVALDADVNNSTFAGQFVHDDKLSDRFFECRIAEQNMFSVAAGLAAAGKTPFCSTFAKFVTRGYDQIEMAINSGCQLKIAGSHAGITLGADGPSQMALPDVAWFSSFATMTHNATDRPGFYVLTPSDAYSAYALTLAAAEHEGSVYLRTLRPETEFLYTADEAFKLGGHNVLMEGSDLLIIASGYMVHEVNRALDALDEHHIEPTIVDLYSLPYDEDAILDLANACNGLVLTVEDNYGNGIGAHIASTVARSGDGFTVEQMHVTKIPKSGKSEADLLKYCGLSSDDIAKKAITMMDALPV
ncbi:MAG: transketolase [Phycisphaeraceae bacterium]